MRVVQAMAGGEVGGAEAFFVRLVTALAETDVEQAAIIRSHPDRAEALARVGIATRQLRFGGRLDIRSRLDYRRALREADPDIVMTWMKRASGLCPSGRFVQIGRLGGFYDLKYYRRCGHLVGNTRGIVDHITAQGWPAKRAHMISNFVDTSFAVPMARAELDTPDDVPLMVALGRLHPNKAFDVLIEAMVDVPEAWLWLAGNGPLDLHLKHHAADRGVENRIRFLGWRDDTAALLEAADLLVCPSRHEPLGNVILEAWARRVPVVAAASQGPSELIIDGDTGLLADVDDAYGLARRIRDALADREGMAAMAERGLAAYEARFSQTAIVAQFRDLFEQVLR